MKSTLLASAAAILLFGAACSNTPPTAPTGEGGSGNPGTGGTTASGGSTGSGGAVAEGGSTGTGGQLTSGAGGSASGGSTGSGGTTGAGGTNSGTGGGGGRASGSGGSNVAGSGGGGGRATGSGGSSMAGSTGQGGMGDISIVGGLDGALMTHDCAKASADGYDCPNIGPCSGNKVTWTKDFPIGGTSGQKYNMTFHVYGVVEPYNYVNATRDAGNNTSVTQSLDLFAHGGTPQPANGNGYDYNTYEVDVYPAGSGMMPDTYWLNSVDNADNPHVNTNTTQHTTFPIDYVKTIPIYGGGKITFTTFDSNCVQVMNCGTIAQNAGNVCNQHHTVSLAGANQPAPSTFHQPYDGPSGNGQQYGQWVFIDVTAVTAQ